MSYLRFNHVFGFLMVLALVSAFLLPSRVSSAPRSMVQNLFAPVARPARAITLWAHDRISPPQVKDEASPEHPRNVAEVRTENDRLRQANAYLQAQLQELKEINADRARLGDLRALCTPFAVFAADAGVRESLLLQASSFAGVRENQPVLCSAGLVGRVGRVGIGSAPVRLATDPGFKVSVRFGRFKPDERGNVSFVASKFPQSVLQGLGNGAMAAKLLNSDALAENEVHEGDWVTVEDPDWPVLKGTRVGRIIAIQKQKEAPGFSEVKVQPVTELVQLREVMVLNKS
jgi:cell shape-determining protein MreC